MGSEDRGKNKRRCIMGCIRLNCVKTDLHTCLLGASKQSRVFVFTSDVAHDVIVGLKNNTEHFSSLQQYTYIRLKNPPFREAMMAH